MPQQFCTVRWFVLLDTGQEGLIAHHLLGDGGLRNQSVYCPNYNRTNSHFSLAESVLNNKATLTVKPL